MTIFSEIYGAYFRIAAKLMKSASLTENDINNTIQTEGFRDSVLFLPQKLIPQKDASDWRLFRRNSDGTITPVTKKHPKSVITNLQRMWLKSKLSDPKIRLFLDDEIISALEVSLKDVKPLYLPSYFRYTDRFSDGDDYNSEIYRNNFRKVLNAVKSGEILEIAFTSGHGQRIRRRFLPLKIEYSPKNDKFRVYCQLIKYGKISDSGIINIGRIEEVNGTGHFCTIPVNMDKYFAERKCTEPVIVRVTTERNAVERFFMEFAPYEKQSERDLVSGNCTVKLWYDRQDETELLIRLLSFGPVIEILGPPDFRQKVSERVMKQNELLFKE
ncbi:MAG: WYL domain-containing protein [Ruminococcus sp.]|nr:WYL domain-containing protein [Ruminococcus sp.]